MYVAILANNDFYDPIREAFVPAAKSFVERTEIFSEDFGKAIGAYRIDTGVRWAADPTPPPQDYQSNLDLNLKNMQDSFENINDNSNNADNGLDNIDDEIEHDGDLIKYSICVFLLIGITFL